MSPNQGFVSIKKNVHCALTAWTVYLAPPVTRVILKSMSAAAPFSLFSEGGSDVGADAVRGFSNGIHA